MSNARTKASFAAPIVAARKWLDGVTFAPERPLINVSQAAPLAPPPDSLRHAMAEFVQYRTEAHLYGPVLGMPELRAALAERTGRIYGGAVRAEQVAITSGCNQAFAAAIAATTAEGDSVIVPTPWYFNHKMWLDMAGVESVPLPIGADLFPDPDRAAALITERTRAIVLITPNNPTGAEYPAELLQAFYELAQARGIKLIVDETYRDFHSQTGAPHDLFADPDWDRTLIHLYSFSKAYRLTGHRVGAMLGAPDLLDEAEKFIDCVTICPSQVGQYAALKGIETLDQWLASERDEILDRRAAIVEGAPALAAKGWALKGSGAYFAYLAHPYDMPSDLLAPRLVREAGVLLLPATMFVPDSDPTGARHVRIAFANLDRAGIVTLVDRLTALSI
ncbi:MAG: aminotransferase [Pseudodonghicola sp.]|nr:aminotransferase [Pseudodonghicola sp.]